MGWNRLIVAGALALALPSLAAAQDSAPPAGEMQLAREIVDQGFPEESRMAMFTGVATDLIAQIRQSIPGAKDDPEMMAAIDAHAERTIGVMKDVLGDHLDPLMDSLVLAYAETFSREELEGLHGFITSPAGHGFLARSAEMTSHPAFAGANQAYMADFMAHLPNLQEQLRADVTAIMEKRGQAGGK